LVTIISEIFKAYILFIGSLTVEAMFL